MPSSTAGTSFLGRVALGVAALAVSLVLFPLLALAPTVLPVTWPRWLGNALFFWPQYLLLPGGVRPTSGTAPVGAGVLPVAAAAFWLLAIAAYARLTLRWRKRWMLPLLFLSAAIAAELALLALGTAGWVPVLDGL